VKSPGGFTCGARNPPTWRLPFFFDDPWTRLHCTWYI
jgi:hypothetical protein